MLEPFFRVLLHALKVVTKELSIIVDTDERNDGSYQLLFYHVPLEYGKGKEKAVFSGCRRLTQYYKRIDEGFFRWLSAVGAFGKHEKMRGVFVQVARLVALNFEMMHNCGFKSYASARCASRDIISKEKNGKKRKP